MLILKKERYVIKKCKEYIEGKLEFNSFWNEYLTNKIFIKYIGKVARKHNYGYIDEYDIVEIQKKNNIPFFSIVGLQFSIDNYLTLRKIQHLINVKELLLYKKWDEYIPYFLDCKSDIYYLLEENDDGKKHSKKYYREWLLKIYRVKKYPPKWLQCCEWPMVDGKPLLFLYQAGFPNKHDFITYYFQKEDGTIATVEQYD